LEKPFQSLKNRPTSFKKLIAEKVKNPGASPKAFKNMNLRHEEKPNQASGCQNPKGIRPQNHPKWANSAPFATGHHLLLKIRSRKVLCPCSYNFDTSKKGTTFVRSAASSSASVKTIGP
jgi:hypothetical protein